MSYKILITCPPMLKNIHHFDEYFKKNNLKVTAPEVIQTISEDDLIKILPKHDGWIIGDDSVTRKALAAGKKGRLKALVKWGIGVDNIDFEACDDLKIPVTNTPNMFGDEVSDLAIGYIIGLARETFFIDREIRNKKWPKNTGISLKGKTVGIVGYGDIGRNTATKSKALGLNVIAYDPGVKSIKDINIKHTVWPKRIDECDFIVFTCALNIKNKHMFNEDIIKKCKHSLRVVNVARGGLINELDLCEALKNNRLHSAALDVYEEEPLSPKSYLRKHPFCILGSHNASNTSEAVIKTSLTSLDTMLNFLEKS